MTPSWHQRHRDVAALLERVTAWARARDDLRALLLVGSYARDEARPDSDVDLLLLTTDPAGYGRDDTWLQVLLPAATITREQRWGPVHERRLRRSDGLVVEFGITTPDWAAVPLDPGTRRVLIDGARALHDPDDILTRAVAAVGREPDRGSDARRATSADTDEIVRLATGLFTEINQQPPGEAWHHAAVQAVRLRADNDLIVFVIDAPDRAGGLIALAAGLVTDRLPTTRNPGGRVGYVQWVATDPGWRRHGLAREVTGALLSWFDTAGVGMTELHTSRDAHDLYLSLGFTDTTHPSMRRHHRS